MLWHGRLPPPPRQVEVPVAALAHTTFQGSKGTFGAETGGTKKVRNQKHNRDLVAGSSSPLYTEQRRVGPEQHAMMGIFGTSRAAPLRRDRVILEVQTMRLLCSGLNQRGFAGAAVLDGPRRPVPG